MEKRLLLPPGRELKHAGCRLSRTDFGHPCDCEAAERGVGQVFTLFLQWRTQSSCSFRTTVGSFPTSRPHPTVTTCTGAVLTGLYGLWSVFTMPGFRKIPWHLKVPYLPSSKDQAQNVMKLLQGRRGRLADLGAGDGRLVFAASSAGFQCTGFEINSILVAYARSKAYWRRIPSSQVTFVKKDFWKTNLSSYNNVTAFLAPGVMEVLGEKLLKELPQDALVISCRFPFPNWPQKSAVGSGPDQTFAYEISSVRSHLRNPPKSSMK